MHESICLLISLFDVILKMKGCNLITSRLNTKTGMLVLVEVNIANSSTRIIWNISHVIYEKDIPGDLVILYKE